MWQRWYLLILAVVISGCASTAKAPVGDRARLSNTPSYHTVKQGDTLYSVAFLYGFSFDELATWNNLKPPYTIYKKQRLRLTPPPARAVRKPPAKSPPKVVSASRPKPRISEKPVLKSTPKPASRPVRKSVPKTVKTVTVSPPQKERANRKVIWSWPARGTVIKRYSSSGSGKKGIDIAGKTGHPVKAAASGKVVYSGSGLSGYGRLIILKHNKDFLSAYAHNRKLIAKEGQWVNKGDVIAQMGRSDTDRVKLHFEIRKQGKPVDPLRYLPRK